MYSKMIFNFKLVLKSLSIWRVEQSEVIQTISSESENIFLTQIDKLKLLPNDYY